MAKSEKVCDKHRGGARFCTTCEFGKREHEPRYRERINAAVDAREAARQSVAPRPRNPLYVIHGGRS